MPAALQKRETQKEDPNRKLLSREQRKEATEKPENVENDHITHP
jgi:hypothetical protein